MRHADIRTTMNVYGNAATAEMAEAHSKVVRLADATVLTDCRADCNSPQLLEKMVSAEGIESA